MLPMSDDTAQFEAIAPTLRWMPKWVRQNASAKAVWSVVLAVFGAGSWIAHESGQRMALEHANADLQRSQTAQIEATLELSRSVKQIDTNLTMVMTRLEDIGKQVDSQQAKWERVESAAEIPVPRHRKK